MSDGFALICMRVCDLAKPHVKSHRGVYCALCGTEVWVSIRAPLVSTLWCAPCAVKEGVAKAPDDLTVGLAKETEDEVLDYYKRKRGDA